MLAPRGRLRAAPLYCRLDRRCGSPGGVTRRPDDPPEETDPVADAESGGDEPDDDDNEGDDDEGDEGDEGDDDDVDHFLLDEDSDAPNLVPEVQPRRLLAGRIEMLDKIGEGGMGTVWRGHHLNLDRAVAVKVLGETLQLRADGRERFIREAKALALLDHRNVVRIHDCDQTPDGKLFLCMELLEGETLRELIKRGVRPDPLEVIDVGLQVCEATRAAHERGILHRDLTPSNIIRLRDPARTIKVIDWGLCKYLDLFYVRSPPRYGEPPGSRMVTPYGCRFGTPDYMAPEMLRREGPGAPSFCTDVYALAVVLFELLTGRLPFVNGDHKKPRTIRSLLPAFEYLELETALRDALRFKPDERTQTMAELHEALDFARECLLAQREPPAISSPVTPLAAIEPAVLPAAPALPVARFAEVAASTCEALPMGLAGVAANACEALPGPAPVAPTRPRGRLAGVALSLVLGVVLGVGGTLGAQRLGDARVPAADVPSPALAANLALESARASAAELRAGRCEAEAANISPAPDMSPSPTTPSRPTAATSPEPQIRAPVLATVDGSVPRSAMRPRPATIAQTFQQAMARIEPKIRDCARKAGLAEAPTTVQVRRKGGALDTVRVLKLTKEHPFSTCVDQTVRKATLPPGTSPIEAFTFFQ
jgi:predicted Ser/Thr protein kinase